MQTVIRFSHLMCVPSTRPTRPTPSVGGLAVANPFVAVDGGRCCVCVRGSLRSRPSNSPTRDDCLDCLLTECVIGAKLWITPSSIITTAQPRALCRVRFPRPSSGGSALARVNRHCGVGCGRNEIVQWLEGIGRAKNEKFAQIGFLVLWAKSPSIGSFDLTHRLDPHVAGRDQYRRGPN